MRSKGFFWIASRPDESLLWSQAGGDFRLEPAGFWSAAAPREAWEEEAREIIEAQWQEPYGDRQQELVLIGQNMDEAGLCARLDACLLTGEEMLLYPGRAGEFEDPFPSWEWEDEDGDSS